MLPSKRAGRSNTCSSDFPFLVPFACHCVCSFVANLSVCYFKWATNGMGRGTSVSSFDAGLWLFDGSVLDRFRAYLKACPTLCLQVSYKFQILVVLIACPKLCLRICRISQGSWQQMTPTTFRHGTAHCPSWLQSRPLLTTLASYASS